MPPEQFGYRAVPASDLYSLSATLIYFDIKWLLGELVYYVNITPKFYIHFDNRPYSSNQPTKQFIDRQR